MTYNELGRRYIRDYYGMAAEIGQRVVVDGRLGRIVGFDGAYLRVLFDGAVLPVNCHPTWCVTYLHEVQG